MRVYCYSKKTARRNGLGARLPIFCSIASALLACAGIAASFMFKRFQLALLCTAAVLAVMFVFCLLWGNRRRRLMQFAYAIDEDGALYEVSQFEAAKELTARMTADVIGEILGLGSMAADDSALSRVSNLRKLMQSPEYIQSCVGHPGSSLVRRLDDVKKIDESRKRFVFHCDVINVDDGKKRSNQSVVVFKAYSRMDELLAVVRHETFK